MTQKLKFVFGREENNVGKGENADNQHFLTFPQCFPRFLFQRCEILGLCGKEFTEFK